MASFDIIKILGVGLSGLGFLLMYLAFKLIQSLVPLPNVNPLVINSINRYMVVCCAMTITVGIFTFFTAYYKKDEIAQKDNKLAQQDEKIKDASVVLNVLNTTHKNNLVSDSIIKFAKNDTGRSAQDQQKKILDTLQKYVAFENDPALNKTFEMYKTSALQISDSLYRDDLDAKSKQHLTDRFILLNNSINNMTGTIATDRISRLDAKF